MIFAFLLFAYFCKMSTILWMAENVLGFAVTALIVVLQPELRSALEQLGKKSILTSVLPFETNRKEENIFSEKTINEIVKACVEMSKVKTGALIVIERSTKLGDVVMTGVTVVRGEESETFTEVTDIHFRELSDREIDAYVATGEPMDKAGSYGIQGGAALFCSHMVGDYYNVMGLPVCRLGQMLREIAPDLMEETQ